MASCIVVIIIIPPKDNNNSILAIMPKLVKWNKFRVKCWLIKIDQDLSMETIEWNEEQRKAFLGLVKRICSANRR
ncbi:hypothetical protein TH0950_12600 [Helicobacter pylori]